MKAPYDLIHVAIAAGEKKAALGTITTLVLAVQAGIHLSVAFTATLCMLGGLSSLTPLYPSLPKLLGALVFPGGLLAIIIAGGELVTSNMALVSAAALAQRVTPLRLLRNIGLVFVGNCAGCLLAALFFGLGSGLFDAEPYRSIVLRVALDKIDRGWSTSFFRGVGCNVLVCTAVYSSMAANDVVGKAAAVWPPITAMVFLGLEHVVVDMYAEPMGLMLGADASVWDMLSSSWLPVALGNALGALVISVPYWFAFARDAGQSRQSRGSSSVNAPGPGPGYVAGSTTCSASHSSCGGCEAPKGFAHTLPVAAAADASSGASTASGFFLADAARRRPSRGLADSDIVEMPEALLTSPVSGVDGTHTATTVL